MCGKEPSPFNVPKYTLWFLFGTNEAGIYGLIMTVMFAFLFTFQDDPAFIISVLRGYTSDSIIIRFIVGIIAGAILVTYWWLLIERLYER